MILLDDFDSRVLGKRCGITDDYATRPHTLGWHHIRAIVPLSDATPGWRRVQNFEADGYRLVSIRGTFEGSVIALGAYDQARTPTDDEAAGIIARAPQLFAHSRFEADSFYSPGEIQKIHEAWIARLLNERRLYVCGPFGAPRAFVGFEHRDDVLELELIGSLDSRPGSGLHMLSSLVVEERTPHVRAKTQLSNLPAVGLYQNSGLRLVRTEAILTWSKSYEETHV